jgi:riboflavin biosynthesis pyrimidine reductase
MRKVITTANLIVGSDGATTAGGSSIGLSTAQDRSRFNNLRGKSDLILIGGNTARREPYKRTPIPLYILTHGSLRLQPKNQLVKQFMMPVADLVSQIARNFPPVDSKLPINLLVEAGPKLLQEMIDQGLIDYLYLTINHEKTGENQISVEKLTTTFKLAESEKVGSCQFNYYKKV